MIKKYAMHVKDNAMYHVITGVGSIVVSGILGFPGTTGF